MIEEEKAEKAEKLYSRIWILTTIKELRAYIKVYIYIELNPKMCYEYDHDGTPGRIGNAQGDQPVSTVSTEC